MKLQIERTYVDAMVAKFPELEPLKDQLRFGNKAEVPFNRLSSSELGYLGNLYQQAGPDMHSQAAMIATLQKALNDDGQKYSAEDLERLVPAIAGYLVEDALRGWLFSRQRLRQKRSLSDHPARLYAARRRGGRADTDRIEGQLARQNRHRKPDHPSKRHRRAVDQRNPRHERLSEGNAGIDRGL